MARLIGRRAVGAVTRVLAFTADLVICAALAAIVASGVRVGAASIILERRVPRRCVVIWRVGTGRRRRASWRRNC